MTVRMPVSEDSNKPPWGNRRRAAASLLAAGIPMREVARRLQLSPVTARRYEALFATGGAEAILRLNDVGRRSVLDVGAVSRLTSAIKHSPRRRGFETDVWDREQLLAYIKREFGITFPARTSTGSSAILDYPIASRTGVAGRDRGMNFLAGNTSRHLKRTPFAW